MKTLFEKRRHAHRRGFTLIELLVVVAIIALLLGILLPALAAVRSRAKGVAATSQLNSISKACDSYLTTFQAYPGYFSENDMTNGTDKLYSSALTSTENLVLSLLGQVVPSGTSGATQIGSTGKYFANVGEGPRTDTGRVYGAFYKPKSGELQVSSSSKYSGVNDNDLEEIIGVQSGMPVVYYRAVGGQSKPVGVRSSDGRIGWISNCAWYNSTDLTVGKKGPIDQAANSLLSNASGGGGSNDDAATNLAWVATNPTLSNYSDGPEDSNDVLAGAYLLIEAGEDSIYMNKKANGGNGGAMNQSAYEAFETDNDDAIITGGS